MPSKIKFLVDENVDFPVVLHLRSNGFDVLSISESHPSLDDAAILKMAFEQDRVVITCDKDFGELIFKKSLKSEGIILFRLADQSSKAKIKVLDILLEKYLDRLHNGFVVIEEGKLRIRRL